jgi:Xaa-Pro dipeptidase
VNASAVQTLRKGSYISVELNTQTEIPEWGGQKIYVMSEDDAYLTDDGFKFFQPRQTAFYLIKSK